MRFLRSSSATSLSSAERTCLMLTRVVTAAYVAAIGAAVPLMMRLPLARLARVLEPRRQAVSDLDSACMERRVAFIDEALRRGRPFVRPGCLSRGVTRYWFLRRAGADVVLCFGTGKVESQVQAHCWLTIDGTPLYEPEDDTTFSTLVQIRRPGVLQAVG